MKPNYLWMQWVRSDDNTLIFLLFLTQIFYWLRHEKVYTLVLTCSYCSSIFYAFPLLFKLFSNLIESLFCVIQQKMRKKKFVFSNQPFPASNFPEFILPPKKETPALVPVHKTATTTQTSQIKSPIKMYANSPIEHEGHGYGQQRDFKYETGVQMDRMANMLEKLGNKNKMMYARKQNVPEYRAMQIPSDQSIQSEVKLPHIMTNYSENSDESKLMEEIRRVENKIRQLKYERTQFGAQQNNFESIRPFLEIQNQNMINLQMMILAQNKNNVHQCYKMNNNNDNTKNNNGGESMIKVLPMVGGNCCNGCGNGGRRRKKRHMVSQSSIQSSQTSEDYQRPMKESYKKVSKKRNKKLPKKKYNLYKLRKFRAAVIAVYFSLLFPKYVNKFTVRRYKNHVQQFANKDININTMSDVVLQDLLSINLSTLVEDVQNQKRQRPSTSPLATAKIMISQQHEGKQNFQFSVGDIEVFLSQFIKKLDDMVNQNDFDELYRYLSFGNLPYSFPVDQFHFLEEMYRCKYHPKKLYIKMTEEESKAFLMSFFFIKIFLFRFLFEIKDNFEWKRKVMKKNKIKNNDMINVELATTQLYFSGIILHGYVMQMIQEVLQTSDGNGHSLGDANLPIPMKVLYFNHVGELEEALGGLSSLAKKKKTAIVGRDLSLSDVKFKKLDIEQYVNEELYKFEYIKNLQGFSTLMQMVQNQSEYKTGIKDRIMDMTDVIYNKVMHFRKKEYRRIKDELILEEKYLLKKKIDYGDIKMQPRNNEEKKFIKSIARLMKDSKEKEKGQLGDQEEENEQSQEGSDEDEDDEDEDEDDQDDQDEQDDDEEEESSVTESSNPSSQASSSIPSDKKLKKNRRR